MPRMLLLMVQRIHDAGGGFNGTFSLIGMKIDLRMVEVVSALMGLR